MVFNVMVVDDSSVMRAMIIKTLKMSGAPVGEVYQAGNGQEALEVLQENWVDLALVDINMPVMNGEELIERVRENDETRDLAIIVVSTESSETRIQKILGKGAKFVHKPFTPEILRETIVSVTGVNDEWGSEVPASTGSDLDF
jgi:two-component system chemotaxis response regulator CheY